MHERGGFAVASTRTDVLLGSEKILDEKKEKRAEARAKRAAEAKKAMEEAEAQAQVESESAPAEGGDKKE